MCWNKLACASSANSSKTCLVVLVPPSTSRSPPDAPRVYRTSLTPLVNSTWLDILSRLSLLLCLFAVLNQLYHRRYSSSCSRESSSTVFAWFALSLLLHLLSASTMTSSMQSISALVLWNTHDFVLPGLLVTKCRHSPLKFIIVRHSLPIVLCLAHLGHPLLGHEAALDPAALLVPNLHP